MSPWQFHLSVVKLTLLKITCTLQVVRTVKTSEALMYAGPVSVLGH